MRGTSPNEKNGSSYDIGGAAVCSQCLARYSIRLFMPLLHPSEPIPSSIVPTFCFVLVPTACHRVPRFLNSPLGNVTLPPRPQARQSILSQDPSHLVHSADLSPLKRGQSTETVHRSTTPPPSARASPTPFSSRCISP